jgi:hypothetical protein
MTSNLALKSTPSLNLKSAVDVLEEVLFKTLTKNAKEMVAIVFGSFFGYQGVTLVFLGSVPSR